MRFAFTDDQLLFRDTVGELFAKECPPEAVRWSWNDDNGRNSELWATLAEMGVTGLTVPESHGGMGMNEVDLLPILTEAGRYAFPGPIVETIAVAAPLLAESAPPRSPSAGCRGSPTVRSSQQSHSPGNRS
jgi:alkylation response protein AidB-like acyl-CoA dehydrogenase